MRVWRITTPQPAAAEFSAACQIKYRLLRGRPAPMQLYPPHIRLDFRNLNPNISLLPRLHDARDIGLAMLALLRPHRKLARRIGMQRPVRAEMRLALGLARRLARRFVALAGWGYLNCRASST